MKIFFDIFLKKKTHLSNIEGVEIQRSSRRTKTVSLKIKNGKPVIYCPNFIDDNYLKKIIIKKKKWIENNLKEKTIIKFSEKKKFPILGKNYKILFLNCRKTEVRITENFIRISCKNKLNMRSIFISWLKNESKKYLKNRVSILSKRIKIHPQAVFVKTYSARWGCCTSKSEIFLNWKLILLPKRIIDYVIFHELSHILVPNHSKEFWSTVEKFDLNYIEKKDWLKKNGFSYIQFN